MTRPPVLLLLSLSVPGCVGVIIDDRDLPADDDRVCAMPLCPEGAFDVCAEDTPRVVCCSAGPNWISYMDACAGPDGRPLSP